MLVPCKNIRISFLLICTILISNPLRAQEWLSISEPVGLLGYENFFNENKGLWILMTHDAYWLNCKEYASVQRYYYDNHIIVGYSDEEYFVFFMSSEEAGKNCPTVEFYNSESEWHDRLEAINIDIPSQWLVPVFSDESKSLFEIMPWDYCIMRNLFGLDDTEWFLILLCIPFMACFFLGFHRRRNNFTSARKMSTVIGLLVAVIGLFTFIRPRFEYPIVLIPVALIFCPFICYVGARIGEIACRLTMYIRHK